MAEIPEPTPKDLELLTHLDTEYLYADLSYDGERAAKLIRLLHHYRTRCEVLERELDMWKTLHTHALECVDDVFQSWSGHEPILPDFLGLGECKFRGVVKLAKAYKELELERDDAQTELLSMINAVADTRSFAAEKAADWKSLIAELTKENEELRGMIDAQKSD